MEQNCSIQASQRVGVYQPQFRAQTVEAQTNPVVAQKKDGDKRLVGALIGLAATAAAGLYIAKGKGNLPTSIRKGVGKLFHKGAKEAASHTEELVKKQEATAKLANSRLKVIAQHENLLKWQDDLTKEIEKCQASGDVKRLAHFQDGLANIQQKISRTTPEYEKYAKYKDAYQNYAKRNTANNPIATGIDDIKGRIRELNHKKEKCKNNPTAQLQIQNRIDELKKLLKA